VELVSLPSAKRWPPLREDELGTELIHRTSRSIALTEAGREFYESSSRILDDFENAASRIGRGQTAPKGLIRVTVAPTLPCLPEIPFGGFHQCNVVTLRSKLVTISIRQGDARNKGCAPRWLALTPGI
jgi:hypothetical protein